MSDKILNAKTIVHEFKVECRNQTEQNEREIQQEIETDDENKM